MLKVSFYSYKGGAGRSTTSWNTIERLSRLMSPTREKPFVIVDMDTQSAGSTYLYKAADFFSNNIERSPFRAIQTHMLMDHTESEKDAYFKKMYPVGIHFGFVHEAILFVGVDVDRESPSVKNADVEGKNKELSTKQWQNFRSNIIEACEDYGASALFFDTPTGTQFLARESVYASDVVVCCMRPTDQFRTGTYTQIRNFLMNDSKKSENQGEVPRKYVLTPTAVCTDKQQFGMLGNPKEDYPQKAFDDIRKQFSAHLPLNELGEPSYEGADEFEKYIDQNLDMDMFSPTPEQIKIYKDSEEEKIDKNGQVIFGIPEIKRFKWFEECLGKFPKEELDENDKMAVNRYEYLAQTIYKYNR